MPNPFFPLAISLAGGIWCGRVFGWPWPAWAVILAVCLAGGWLAYGKRRSAAAAACLMLTAFSLGALRSVETSTAYRDHPLRRLSLEDYVDIEGRLICSPSREERGSRLTLEVERLTGGKRCYFPRGRVRVLVLAAGPEESSRIKALLPGDKVRLSARLSREASFLNFGLPPGDRFLEQQGLHRTAFAKSALLVERTAAGAPGDPRRWASSLRRLLLDKIERHFHGPGGALSRQGAVAEAILLGERGRLDAALERSLQDSGLYHLIAISGAHIAVFAGLLYALLRSALFNRRAASLALVLFLVFYAMLVEGRASVLRAVMMAVLFICGKLFWKDVSLLNTVSLSAFALLLWSPVNLWETGFQLSFAATLSIILFAPRLERCLPPWPFKLGALLSVSLSAHLAVAPILVSSFHRLAWAGIVLNLAAVPLTAAVMAAGYAFLASALIHPLLGQAAGAVLEALVRLFVEIARLPSGIPWLSYRLPAPPAPVMIAYLVLLAGFLFPLETRGTKTARLVLFLAALATLSTYPFPARHSPGLRLTFLDVGQGDAILVEFPGRRKMLVDAGGTSLGDFDVGESVVSPVLWGAGMKKVDYLVLTHDHPDHAGGMAAIGRSFRIGEFWATSPPGPDGGRSRSSPHIPPGTPSTRPPDGMIRTISGVQIEAHTVPRTEGNESSVVLKLAYGRHGILLTGDIGRRTEGLFLAQGRDLAASVLKVAHHGSDTSSSNEFLERVRPGLAVISVGRNNTYGLPSPRVLSRLSAAGARIFRTDRDGAVEVSTDGRVLAVRTARGMRPQALTLSGIFPILEVSHEIQKGPDFCRPSPRLGPRPFRPEPGRGREKGEGEAGRV